MGEIVGVTDTLNVGVTEAVMVVVGVRVKVGVGVEVNPIEGVTVGVIVSVGVGVGEISDKTTLNNPPFMTNFPLFIPIAINKKRG